MKFKKLFINLKQASSIVSNITYKTERLYKAYTEHQSGREIFVSIEDIRKHDPELAEKIENEK